MASDVSKLERIDRYRVRSFECGPDAALQVHRMLDWAQETASLHAQALDFAFPDIGGGNRGAWVLAQMRVEISSMPRWNEEVDVKTFLHDTTPLFGHRDFVISKGDGTVVANLATRWVLVDPHSRHVVRIPQSVREKGSSQCELHFGSPDAAFSRLRFEASPKETPVAVSSHRATYAHMDLNGHVNNVHYVEWMLESVPESTRKSARLRSFEIAYRSETVRGETVQSQCFALETPGAFFHRVTDDAGKVRVEGTSFWA